MSATQTVSPIVTNVVSHDLLEMAIANTPTQVRSATPALPMPAKPAGTPAPIARDTAPTIVKGQWVSYTSKAGKTSKYLVGWVGTCKFTGKPKVGLIHFSTKKLFFVYESAVTADTASNPVRRGRRTRQVATGNPATAKQWRFIGCLRKAVAAKRPDLANVQIADTTKAASAYIKALLAACRDAGIKLSYGRKTGRMICCCGVPSCPIGPFTCPA